MKTKLASLAAITLAGALLLLIWLAGITAI